FQPSDGAGSLEVALISEPLARKHFPEGKALGSRIRIGESTPTIVGVVGPVKQTAVAESAVTIYLPLRQSALRDVAFAVRTTGDPLVVSGSARETLHQALPDQPISELMPMTQVVEDNALLGARYAAGLLGVLGVIALLLSAVGIYGVVSQWVLRR